MFPGCNIFRVDRNVNAGDNKQNWLLSQQVYLQFAARLDFKETLEFPTTSSSSSGVDNALKQA